MDSLPRRLEEDLKRGKVIPFVGGGVSMAVRAKDTGKPLFPSWKELLERAVERLEHEGRGPYAKIVDGLVEIGPEKYLEAAKHARYGLTGSLWFEFLREQLDIPREDVADDSLDLASAIWQLGSSLIITTNHDRVLHWGCPWQSDISTWDIEAPAEQVEAGRRGGPHRPTLWHLHGWVDNAARIILTRDGYQHLYRETGGAEGQYQAALTALRQFIISHTLLFIGFSLDDPYIGVQLRGLQEIFQGAIGPHYALVRVTESGKADSLLKAQSLPIQIVTFPDFGEPLLTLVQSMGLIASQGQVLAVNRGPASDGTVSKCSNPPSAPSDFGPANYIFYVPYRQKGDQVVGRQEAMEAVHRQLTAGHQRTSIGQSAAFQGLGGLGKTQLAIEYAYRYKDEYPNGVIWINADQDIETQLSDLAERARWVAPESEHKYKLDVARQRLKTYSDCLIIFDNLEDVGAILSYLPEPQANPHILVTSRSEQPWFAPFPLDLLDEDLSLKLLTQEADRSPEGDGEWEAARKTVKALDGLPLALELAGGYLRHRRSVTWEQYYQLLDQNLKGAMPGRFLSSSFTNHEADIYCTLKLNDEFFADEPLLKEVNDLLTWSGSAPMGLSLMHYLLGLDDGTALTGALGLGVELRLMQKTPGEERYALHRLVREVRREDVPLNGREEGASTVCQRTGEWFQQRRQDISDLMAFQLEIDHLQAWQQHATKYVPQHASRLMWLQGSPPFHQGRYREAREWVEQALRLYREFGLRDEELEAQLLNDLGTCYGHLGDHHRALEYKEQGLSIRRELYGETHMDTATSLNNVGVTYGELGDYRRALDSKRQALAVFMELFGEKHPHTAGALNNIGSTYSELGDHRRALKYMEQALAIYQELFGEKHPHTASALSNMGAICSHLGDHRRALEYTEQALATRRELFGEKHPDTATSLDNVGVTYGDLGDYRQALYYKEQALAIRRELFGEKHPDTATSLNNVGATYSNLGDHLRALEYRAQALPIYKELFGEKHPHTARSLNNMGATYSNLGDHRRALEYREQALAIRRETLGEKHPDTVNSILGLTNAYSESGNAFKAVNLLEEVLSQFPREHPAYARLRQSKQEVLSRLTRGGFRQQPRKNRTPTYKKRRR